MPLKDLWTRPEVFQYRDKEVENHHVEDIASVIKLKRTVDPLDVWKDPSNGALVVIDGHHRLAAYKRAGVTRQIPVVIFEGPETAARLHALSENAKARLPMTATEKNNAAWRLVCLTADDGKSIYSKADVTKHTGASDGTVGNMRRTRRKLLKADEWLPETWKAALAQLKGQEQEELSDEDWNAIIRERAQRLDDKVGKEIGHMGDLQIDAVALMLEKRLGGKTEILGERWRTDLVDGEEFPF